MKIHGFSLVELSIVLVILGLLTGGILGGQSLMKAAELRSVTQEFKSYQIAVSTFQDLYFALPGDMGNAESYWGSMTNCGAASPSGTGTQTCSGNGDGWIDDAAAASQTGEDYMFWQHLANAGLIEGQYTGIAGTGGFNDSDISQNVPRSKYSSGGWDVTTLGNWPGNASSFGLDYGMGLKIGSESIGGGTGQPLFTPEEAWNIDSKIDDGKPAYGKVIAAHWNDECSSADDGSSAMNDREASYRLQDASIKCSLHFIKLF